ncbi:MAG: DUF58 domain-containing protein [Planctomycetes bacterium]|nr:DUF58 domain-containing protein [Planctomycetota bacterium]
MLRTTNPTRPKGLEDLIDARLISRLGPLDISSRKVFFGKLKGERRSKKRGESVEFADHRAYVSGDDLRHIDWNIFARLDGLFMKLFLEEEDLSLHIVIDASASSDCGEPSKFLFMQRAAMAIGYVGLVNLNRVAATAMGEGDIAGHIRDLRGRRRTQDLARFICSLEPTGSFSFRAAAERIVMSRRGKGIMLVFSDFFFKEGFEQGLRMLVGRGYDVYVVQVLSPQEIDPPLTGDLRLKDVEDNDLAEITVSAPLLKKYKANLNAYCATLQNFCARREMNFISIRSDTPVDTLILDYLRQKGVIR